ncbi:hypothetical protein ACFL0D_08105 [Thermoproteota archaeon]
MPTKRIKWMPLRTYLGPYWEDSLLSLAPQQVLEGRESRLDHLPEHARNTHFIFDIFSFVYTSYSKIFVDQ